MKTYTVGCMGVQKAGGIASLFIALAYLAAIPYFVVLVNYSGVTDPALKVILLRANYTSMHLMHTVSFEFVALGLIVLILAVYTGFERTGSCVRASPNRLVLMARDRYVADQVGCHSVRLVRAGGAVPIGRGGQKKEVQV